MAGVYPDIPGTRFALDADGTIMKWRDLSAAGPWQDVSSSIINIQTLGGSTNLYTNVADYNSTAQVVLAFPEARTISGLYIHIATASGGTAAAITGWSYSTDTTDGTDGNWTDFTVDFAYFGSHNETNDPAKPYYRSDIAPLALSNVKGIRMKYHGDSIYRPQINTYHLYGNRPLTGVDRLAFWHPTLDQQISPAALDFGDLPQGTSNTLEVRLKNASTGLQATGTSVKISDIKPEYDSGNMQLSLDNNTFATTLDLGDLAPGAVSPIVYVKRTVPATQEPGLRFARLIADAVSWS